MSLDQKGCIFKLACCLCFVGSPKEIKQKTKNSSSRQETPPQPVPPESFLLHLGVTARTHPIGEFYKAFPLEVNNFVIDQ